MSDKDYLIKGEMYQYNLGWLIKELMSFKQDLATAIDLKTINYADPIQWDITTQYPANTVVVDPNSGTAYMSKVPVPAGVELNNTNYWVVVFNYQDIYNKIMDGVAFNDRDQDYATKDLLVNDLVWYAGGLYRVTREIPTGSKYIPETNLIKTSIESLLSHYYGRDRTAQISNDTVNVSGDYTLAAGDIAETSTNRTIRVDGVSTVNVGGLRTEVYAGDKTEKVTGTSTEEFTGTHTENHTGKKIVNAEDIVLNPTEPLTYRAPVIIKGKKVVETKAQDGTPVRLLTDENAMGITVDGELVSADITPFIDGSGAQLDNTELAYTKNIIRDRAARNANNILRVVSANWPTKSFITADSFLREKYKESMYSLLRLAPDVVGTCENQENQKYRYADYATTEYLKNAYYKNLRTINLTYNSGYDDYVWIDGGYGGEGNGIISALPLSRSGYNRLPAQGNDQNTVYWSGAVYSDINFNGINVRVYSYHGNYLSPDFAKNDISRFAEILKNDTTPNIILVGDWNLDYLTSPDGYMPLLNAGYTIVNKDTPTFPYNNPNSILDNVFVKGAINVVNYGVSTPLNTGAVGEGNDHLFVWADLKIGG